MTSKTLAPHAFVLPPHVSKGTTSTRCADCGFTSRAKVHVAYIKQEVTSVMEIWNEVATGNTIPAEDSMERAAATLNSPDLPGADCVCGRTAEHEHAESMEEFESDDGLLLPIAGYKGKLSSSDEVIASNHKALLSMGCSEAQVKEFKGRTFSALPKWLRTRIKKLDKPAQPEPRKVRPAAGELAFYLDPLRFRPMVVEGKPVPLHVTRKAEYEAKKRNLAPLSIADVDRRKRGTAVDSLMGVSH